MLWAGTPINNVHSRVKIELIESPALGSLDLNACDQSAAIVPAGQTQRYANIPLPTHVQSVILGSHVDGSSHASPDILVG